MTSGPSALPLPNKEKAGWQISRGPSGHSGILANHVGVFCMFSIPVETFLGGEGGGDWPQGRLIKCHPRRGLGLLWTEMTIAWLMRQVREVWREGSRL